MTEEEREAIRDDVRGFMSCLTEWIAPRFPHHSAAMRQELGRPRMTTDRWNRIACLLSSLSSLPGEAFTPGEHDVRNIALAAIPVAQKMAAATLGCTRDPDNCMHFASWRSAEINARMKT